MGRYYALHDGEDPDGRRCDRRALRAARAPTTAARPRRVSVAVALADKIDTLAGFFAIDEKPTGSQGSVRAAPRGARRHPPHPREQAAAAAARQLQRQRRLRCRARADAAAVTDELLDFFADRLKVALREQGVRHDLDRRGLRPARERRGRSGPAAGAGRGAARVPRNRGRRQSADRLSARRRISSRIEERKDATRYDGDPIPRLLPGAGGAGACRELTCRGRARAARRHRARGFRRCHGGAGAAAAAGR